MFPSTLNNLYITCKAELYVNAIPTVAKLYYLDNNDHDKMV